MYAYIIYESSENSCSLEYIKKNINNIDYFIPKSVSWKLVRIFNDYVEAFNYANKTKINNSQVICKMIILNIFNNILDQCNIKLGSHGYTTGMNLGIQSNIKILPPCNIEDILTVITRDKTINLH
jgi:hypothetical protein